MTPAPQAAKTELPAGPPIPTTLQAAIWALRPLELMDRCEARYGEIGRASCRERVSYHV